MQQLEAVVAPCRTRRQSCNSAARGVAHCGAVRCGSGLAAAVASGAQKAAVACLSVRRGSHGKCRAQGGCCSSGQHGRQPHSPDQMAQLWRGSREAGCLVAVPQHGIGWCATRLLLYLLCARGGCSARPPGVRSEAAEPEAVVAAYPCGLPRLSRPSAATPRPRPPCAPLRRLSSQPPCLAAMPPVPPCACMRITSPPWSFRRPAHAVAISSPLLRCPRPHPHRPFLPLQ